MQFKMKLKDLSQNSLFKTLIDFGGDFSGHGVSYILKEGQSLAERIVWFLILLFFILLTIMGSYQAYTDWKEDPMITSVSTVARKIKTLEWPMVTICGQGREAILLKRVIKEQVRRHLQENNRPYENLTTKEEQEAKEDFMRDTYPSKSGKDQTINLEFLSKMMTSPDPSTSVEAEVATKGVAAALEQVSGDNLDVTQEISSGCPAGWFQVSVPAGVRKKRSAEMTTTTSIGQTTTAASSTAACPPEIDIFYEGESIDITPNIPDWQSCAKFCSEAATCSHWSWSAQSSSPGFVNICFRKANGDGRVSNKGVISGFSTCEAIDGGWSEYSDWSSCSKTCHIGVKSRSRTCTNPLPQFGGQECQGNETQTESCVVIENCPSAEPESEPETEPESNSEPESEPETEPESNSEPESEPETEPESNSEPEDGSSAEPESKTEPDPESEAEPELETEPEPESNWEPEEMALSTSCYKLAGLENPLSKAEADTACQEQQNGASMAKFSTDSDWTKLMDHLKNLETPPLKFTLGHTWQNSHWSHNLTVSNLEGVRNTAAFEPTNPQLVCTYGSLDDEKVHAGDCSSKRPFLCQVKKTQSLKRKKRSAGLPQSNPPTYDVYLNPSKTDTQVKTLKALKKLFREKYNSINMTKGYTKLFEMIWFSVNPCYDMKRWTSDTPGQRSMIKRCLWKGEEKACADLFTPGPTDRDICCSLNPLDMDNKRAMDFLDLYRDSNYSEAVARMQKDGYMHAHDSNRTKSKLTPEAGLHKGVTIILDLHSDRMSAGTIFDDFQGFVTTITNKKSFPSVYKNRLTLRPGHENFVSIKATNVATDPSIRSIPPAKRDCFFSDEYQLKMYKIYSQTACIYECSMETVGKKIGCVPWHLPSLTMEICDPWTSIDFRQQMEQVDLDVHCSHCLDDCEGTQYTAKVTAVPFRRCDSTNLALSSLCKFGEKMIHPSLFQDDVRREYHDKMGNVPGYVTDILNGTERFRSYEKVSGQAFSEIDLEGDVYDAYEKDIAVVHFFFDGDDALEFERNHILTWTGFIGQIGGLIGLCIGLSMISLVEIAYFILLGVYRCVMQSKKLN